MFALIATCMLPLIGLAESARAAEVVKLKYANYFPVTSDVAKLTGQFCDEIKKRTNGRVEITLYAGGTLLTGPRMFDGVTQGVADIGFTNTAYTVGKFPVTRVLELPLGFVDAWVGGQVSNDFYNKYKPKEWDSVHVLYFCNGGASVVESMKKPVKTLNDLKGLKIRGVGMSAAVPKSLGATPVPLEMGDVYEALRRGVLDGVFQTVEGMKQFKTGELLKYVTNNAVCTGNAGIFFAIMNKQKYNSLPSDIQKIFDQVAEEYRQKALLMWTQGEIDGLSFFKSNGGQVVELAPAECAEWAKAVEPLVDEYKKKEVEKGRSAKEIDDQIAFVKERIKYWTAQEKVRKIPTVW